MGRWKGSSGVFWMRMGKRKSRGVILDCGVVVCSSLCHCSPKGVDVLACDRDGHATVGVLGVVV